MVDIGATGRQSDGGVWANSEMGRRMREGALDIPPAEPLIPGGPKIPYCLVGDEAFPLTKYPMRPYPRSGQLDLCRRIFNYRLSRARRIVECAFGILTSTFRIFGKNMSTKLDNTLEIIKASICLHNFILTHDPKRQLQLKSDKEKLDCFENCLDTLPEKYSIPEKGTPASVARENLAHFFLTHGAVKFQWERAINSDF